MLNYLAKTSNDTANSAIDIFLLGKLTFFPVFYESILFLIIICNYININKLELIKFHIFYKRWLFRF